MRYAVCCNGQSSATCTRTTTIEVTLDHCLVHDLWHDSGTGDLRPLADGGVFTARDRWHIIDEMDVSEATRYVVTSCTCCDKSVDR